MAPRVGGKDTRLKTNTKIRQSKRLPYFRSGLLLELHQLQELPVCGEAYSFRYSMM